MIGQKKAPDNQGQTLITRRAAKKPNNTKKQKKLLGGAGWGARNTDPTSTIEVAKTTILSNDYLPSRPSRPSQASIAWLHQYIYIDSVSLPHINMTTIAGVLSYYHLTFSATD